MGGKAKAPKAPDYAALAREQARLNQEQLQQQTVANRPNQTNPLGSLNWVQDPVTKQWTQTETWDPKLKELFDKQQGLQGQQLTDIQELMNRPEFGGGPALPTYDQASGEEYGRTFTESLLARVRPQQERDRQSTETRLRLQGLQPGTEAYNRAYQNLLTSQGDVTSQAELQGLLAGQKEARDIYTTQLQGQGQGYQQALQNYLLPWQTASANQGMVNNSYVATPQFQPFATAGMGQSPDIMGAAQQQYAQQMQSYNDAQAKKSGKGQAIGTIVGGVGGFMIGGPMGAAAGASLGGAAGGSLASDERVKDDIAPISDEDCYKMMRQLMPISWRWTGTSVVDRGISAQDVLAMAPELVNRGARGLLTVNYSELFARLLGAFRHMAKMQEEEEKARAAAG